MKIKAKYKKKYPYLAILTFGDPLKQDPNKYEMNDIMLISKIPGEEEDTEDILVQYINGHRQGWVTKNEKDYAPLPTGYKIILKQA